MPVAARGDHYVLMSSEEILGEGFESASDWVKRAEKIFRKHSKDTKITAQGYLNYQSKLFDQDPRFRFLVLYNKSGTNISAAYLSASDHRKIGHLAVQGFVAESVTYRIQVDSEAEARYLTAILNSGVVNKAIKPYQTEGVYHGKRDIHRRPFEVCAIRQFNPSEPDHLQLVDLARAANSTIAKWGPTMEGGLAKIRETARQLIAAELSRIDSIVTKILGNSISTKDAAKRRPNAQAPMFDEP